MGNRSLAETLVFVNLLFISSLSVRACSGVHNRVRGCFGTVRVMFGYRSGYVRALFGYCSGTGFLRQILFAPKNRTALNFMPIKNSPLRHRYS